MTNTAKNRGTAWESAIVTYLIQEGWLNTERRALSGGQDKGDISGIPGVMIEAKNAKALTLGTWIKEVITQTLNARAEIGVAWIKRRGHSSPGEAYVVMTGATFAYLLKCAGWARQGPMEYGTEPPKKAEPEAPK